MALLIFLILLLLSAAALILQPRYRHYIPFFNEVRIFSFKALGRVHVCSWSQAVRWKEHHDDAVRLRLELENAVHLKEQDNSLALWDTPQGVFWFPAGTGKRQVAFILAEQASGVYESGTHAVRPGDVVLDCGANVGVFLRTALREGAKQVIAVEPAEDNIRCLRRTFENEIASQRVLIYPKGVWDTEAALPIRIDPGASGHNSFVLHYAGATDGPTVPLTTIDAIVEELHLEGVDFIKLDVEGAEAPALKGASRTISKFKPRISVACEHYPLNAEEVIRVLGPDSNYVMSCGPCLLADRHIFPEVLYFSPVN